MELQMRQLQIAKFEYEVRKKSINLYDRIDSENGEDILKFLIQVPFKENLEISVMNAVERIYENMTTPKEMRVQATDLHSRRKIIDYLI